MTQLSPDAGSTFKLFEAVFQVLFDFKHRLNPDGLAANILEVLVSHGDALQILQTAFQELGAWHFCQRSVRQGLF